MDNDYNAGEPTTRLPDGSIVLTCLSDFVAEFQASGHAISVNDEGRVVVVPRINDLVYILLDTNSASVSAILANEG